MTSNTTPSLADSARLSPKYQQFWDYLRTNLPTSNRNSPLPPIIATLYAMEQDLVPKVAAGADFKVIYDDICAKYVGCYPSLTAYIVVTMDREDALPLWMREYIDEDAYWLNEMQDTHIRYTTPRGVYIFKK